MSILITTYEGTHNHPLSAAATAMASTTSAAASMLLSGSSTISRPVAAGQGQQSTFVGLHGLNSYSLANGMTSRSPPHQFYIQNTSQISSSSPNTHPTITLDLTTSNPFTSPFANPHFNRFASYEPSSQLFLSKSTSLNFASSMDNNNNPQQSTQSWPNNNALAYKNMYPQSNNRNNHNLGSLTLASRQAQENIYQSFMQKPNHGAPLPNHQQQLPDHIAAATKAITADPSFQTALAAALTSIIGRGTSGGGVSAAANNNNNNGKVQASNMMENLVGQKMKWADQISSQKGSSVGCASSFINASSPSSARSSGLMFLQQPSVSKTQSTSPTDNKQERITN